MTTPAPLAPQAAIAQHMEQLRAIAVALTPTADVEALCESDVFRHPQLSQYVIGTEHLNLAIAYLEKASGVLTEVSTAGESETLDSGSGYDRYSIRSVEVVREQTQPEPE